HAADVPEVAGHQRQHARGGEGDEPGQQRYRRRGEQRTGEEDLGEGTGPGTHCGQPSSASVSSISVRSVAGSICPRIPPASRPSRSSTTVEGIALSGTTPCIAATPSASLSSRLG